MNEIDSGEPRRGRREGEDEQLPPDAARAREALHYGLAPRAEAAFRERLKRDFVTGAIEVTAAPEGLARRRGRAKRAADARVRRDKGAGDLKPVRPFPVHARGHRTATWTAIGVALAAVLVVVAGALNRGPAWGVTAARGDGSIRVEGVPLALDERDAMRKMIVPGAEIDVIGNAEVDLSCGGVVAVQLTPGTRMTVPPPPGRWMGRRMELHARAGELRLTTGPQFAGSDLAILSPSAAVEVKGTTLAVIIEEEGTCVCVYEGTAVVGRLLGGEHADMVPVPAGMRRYVYKDGRPDPLHEMREEEHAKLAEFRETQRPWFEGRGGGEAPPE